MEEISRLEAEKEQYITMKKKLNSVLQSLTSARGYMDNAKSELQVAYTGEAGVNGVNELGQMSEETRTIINSLQGEILPEIDRKINSIESQIMALRAMS